MPQRVPSKLARELHTAIALARAAGAAIEQVRATGFEPTFKTDHSPVTRADLAADKILREGLVAAFPDDGLLTEESGWITPDHTDRVWVIDPLDGTKAFVDDTVRGYAVQLGLLVAERPALGVVYDSRLDRLYYAAAGEGAWLVERGGAPLRVHVSDHDRFETMALVTSTTTAPALRERVLGMGLADGGRLHSVGIKVAELVTGRADLYISDHGVSYWDSCGPLVILTEAGGLAHHIDGRELSYPRGQTRHDGGPFYVSNGARHAELGAALRQLWTADPPDVVGGTLRARSR